MFGRPRKDTLLGLNICDIADMIGEAIAIPLRPRKSLSFSQYYLQYSRNMFVRLSLQKSSFLPNFYSQCVEVFAGVC